MKSYVLGFYFNVLGPITEVALIQKVKPEFQRGKWNGIGGQIEENEAGHRAMRREFLEETGADVCLWRLFGVFYLPGNYEVFCWNSFGVAELTSTTEETVKWWDIQELPQNAMPNLRWLIPLALDSSINYVSIQQDKLA